MNPEEVKKVNDEELEEVAGGRKSNTEVAYDVMNGKYGNGEERVRRLRAAGYDPNEIQRLVNNMVKNGYRDPYMDPDGTNKLPPVYKDPYMN